MKKLRKFLLVAAVLTMTLATGQGFLAPVDAADYPLGRVSIPLVRAEKPGVTGGDVLIIIHDWSNRDVYRFNVYRGNKYIGTVIPGPNGHPNPNSVFRTGKFVDRDGVASSQTIYKVQAVRLDPSSPDGREWGPFTYRKVDR